jgi:hypothetical protein
LILTEHHDKDDRCSDIPPAASVCFGWCFQTGLAIPVDFTVAADSNDQKRGLKQFCDCCLEYGQGVDPRKLTGRFGIIEELQSFLIRMECLSLVGVSNMAKAKHVPRSELLSVCQQKCEMERGIWHLNEPQKKKKRVIRMVRMILDCASSTGIGVEQSIEMTTERLQNSRWIAVIPKQNSIPTAVFAYSDDHIHLPFDHLSGIFRDILEHLDPMDSDELRLLNSFEKRKKK